MTSRRSETVAAWARRPDLCRRRQLRILPQHLPLELLQLRRGVEPELVGECEPRGAVDLERLGLPAAAIEREHQLAAQSLAERVGGDQGLELADERRVAAELELGVDPLLERGEAQLVEPRGLEAREVLLVEIGERGAAPEGERLGQERRARGRIRASRAAASSRSKRWASTLSGSSASR